MDLTVNFGGGGTFSLAVSIVKVTDSPFNCESRMDGPLLGMNGLGLVFCTGEKGMCCDCSCRVVTVVVVVRTPSGPDSVMVLVRVTVVLLPSSNVCISVTEF